MNRAYLVLLAGAMSIPLGACGSDSNSSPTTPPVAATPTPTPSPTATPAPPMARVSAEIFKWTRNLPPGDGVFHVPPSPLPPYFITADWIDIGCTPRDADYRPTPNHPRDVEWYYTSGGDGVLVDKVDYVVVDDNTFVPQVQIRYNTRTGHIDMWCKVGGFESNHVRLEVRYVDPNR
jgi:hypothetical protein